MKRRLATSLIACLVLGWTIAIPPSHAQESTETVSLDSHDSADDGSSGPVSTSNVLASGETYTITVDGTFSVWAEDVYDNPGGCGTPDSQPEKTSPGVTNGPVSSDAEFLFAEPAWGGQDCSDPIPRHDGGPFQIDVGSGFSHVEPIGGEPSSPSSNHTYRYSVTGQGQPASFGLVEDPTSDNYGVLTITVEGRFAEVDPIEGPWIAESGAQIRVRPADGGGWTGMLEKASPGTCALEGETIWTITEKTNATHYNGTSSWYQTSDCAYIGEGQTTWDLDASGQNMTRVSTDPPGTNTETRTYTKDTQEPQQCNEPGAICGGSEDEQIQGTQEDEFIFGGGGNDNIDGGGGDDVIVGGLGNDMIAGGAGKDEIAGGAGKDRILGEGSSAPSARPLTAHQAAESADQLSGGGGNDTVLGQAGNDELNGNVGSDLLKGGAGVNDFNGGPGEDTCVLNNSRDDTHSCEHKKRNFKRNFLPAKLPA